MLDFLKSIPFTQQQVQWIEKLSPKKGVGDFLKTKGVYTVMLPQVKPLNFHSANTVMDNRLMRKGLFYNEPNSKKLWLEWCSNAERVCDIGANIGQFTLMALGVNPKLEVIAIEPFGPNMETLKRNLACNQGFAERTTAHALAIGAQRGSFDLYFDPASPLTPSLIDKPGFVKANQVQVVPFHELTDISLDAIKIDVEGAEVFLMEGLLPYLKKYQPKIIIEILDEDKLKAIQEMTAPLGYQLTPIQEQKGASKNYQMIVNV